MPTCLVHGCPTRVPRGYCPAHKRPDVRPNADVRAWYHTPAWEALKRQVRAEEPCCRQCWTEEDRAVAGTQTDHIVPHRGVRSLFFDRSNLQNLCERHHGMKTRRGE